MIINGTSTNRIDPFFLNEQYIQKLRDDRARLNQIVGSAVFPKEDKQVLFNPNISTTTFQGSHNCTTKQARQNKGQKIGTETQNVTASTFPPDLFKETANKRQWLCAERRESYREKQKGIGKSTWSCKTNDDQIEKRSSDQIKKPSKQPLEHKQDLTIDKSSMLEVASGAESDDDDIDSYLINI